MDLPTDNPLRDLPAVDSVLQRPEIASASRDLPGKLVTEAVRSAVDAVRRRMQSGELPDATAAQLAETVAAATLANLRTAAGAHYRRVINATGIILHTGLGRAVLAPAVIDHIREHLRGYSLLQLGRETGKRSVRDEHVERLLRHITGAEAATVVNNNAAATLLVLNTVGAGREIVVSRGQLVEIGGAFRLPDVMTSAGVTLIEVGTTNRTHPRDYEQAVTENTAALVRVHPSNYVIRGFSSEVSLSEMVRIARAHDVVMIDDVGAGALIDFSRFGFHREPTLPKSIAAGADLVISSADKLIGASQGGIILGRAELIARVRKNPLARAVRVGKLTLAALEATLTLFLDEERVLGELPIVRMLMRPLEDLTRQARRIVRKLRGVGPAAEVTAIDGFSQMGSGSLPGQNLPTRLAAVTPRDMSVDELAHRLRLAEVPVFTRIREGRVLIDPRTLLQGDEPVLVNQFIAALTQEA